jgi:hypothetical protein
MLTVVKHIRNILTIVFIISLQYRYKIITIYSKIKMRLARVSYGMETEGGELELLPPLRSSAAACARILRPVTRYIISR